MKIFRSFVEALGTKIFLVAFAIAAIHEIGQSYGQTGEDLDDIEVGVDALCPQDSALRNFPGITRVKVGVGSSVVKFDNVPIFSTGRVGSRRTEYDLEFNTPIIVYGFNSDQSKLFVKDRGQGNCGWVLSEHILLPRDLQFRGRSKRPQPLQMRDISARENELKNQLNVKAVIHDLSITGEVRGVDAFSDPKREIQIGKIRLFDAFVVFDQLELQDADPEKESRYWLIGVQTSSGATELKGWVRQRDVVIWPSRLAVQWNEGAEVSAWATPEKIGQKNARIASDQVVREADYRKQITRRLPVLEQSPPPQDVIDQLSLGASMEERRAEAFKLIDYYKVVAPGRACSTDSTGKDCLSARETDRARENFVKIQDAARKIDIVILIDATASMEPFFRATVEAINHFMKLVAEEGEAFDIRFSIDLYGDFSEHSPKIRTLDFQNVVPFFRPGPNSDEPGGPLDVLIDDPKNLLFGDLHKDKLEAPFAAIIKSSQTAQWRSLEEVPLRFLIHIADAGNRLRAKTAKQTGLSFFPNTSRATAQSRIVGRYTENDVSTALNSHNVIYVPVAVLGTNKAQPTSIWSKIFHDQARNILSKLKDTPIEIVEEVYSDQATRELESRVAWKVSQILIKVNESIDKYSCPSGDTSPRCQAISNKVEETPNIIILVNKIASLAVGLPEKELANIYSREQSILTVYAKARSANGAETFTHWVALEEREFKALRSLLTRLCRFMGAQDARNPVLRALREFAEMYGNEDFVGLSVNEILGKRLGIPNLERTDFSGRTRDEVDDAHRAWQLGEDKSTWNNWHTRACKAAKFTQLMEDDKKASYDQIRCNDDNTMCSVADGLITDFRWSVQVSKAAPTLYVPLDILP